MFYATARELFESAREAAIDIAKCTRQLDALEERALSLGSPSFDAHVSGGIYDRVGEGVARYVEREAMLTKRIEGDYELIDVANGLLYGQDGITAGLAAIAPPWWADVLYWRYLAVKSWSFVAEMVGYAECHVRRAANAAFEIMDANGMAGTVEGRGMAES